jgi:hypothetical protein
MLLERSSLFVAIDQHMYVQCTNSFKRKFAVVRKNRKLGRESNDNSTYFVALKIKLKEKMNKRTVTRHMYLSVNKNLVFTCS